MKLIPIHVVDAFTALPFSGNPAAVCYLLESREEIWMQQVAKEMNLSETAFFVHSQKGYQLRWFTPTAEVDLCGHATLAAAHIIWETDLESPDNPIHFETKSGILIAKKHKDLIELDFPSDEITEISPPESIVKTLGFVPEKCFKGKFDFLVELENAEAVRNFIPDFEALKLADARGLIITALSDQKAYDIISRYFAPAFGVTEDPVTGSAHCTLAPYWFQRIGKKNLKAFQASSRGGEIITELQGKRTLLRGQAVTVLQGVLSGLAAGNN